MKVLLVDDNLPDRQRIIRALAASCPLATWVEVWQPQDVEAALGQTDFDVVLTEYMLPWTDGLTLLAEVKERFPHLPVVMLTDRGSEVIAAEGMKAGLSDYVLKQRLEKLPEAIQASLDKTRQQAARQQAAEDLQAQAHQQAAVADLGQRALAGLDLTTLLNEAVTLVAHVLAADYCEVMELEPQGQTLRLCAGAGWPVRYVGRATIDAGLASQSGYTLLADAPVVVDDMRTETRFRSLLLLHGYCVISGVTVIIHGTPRPFGVLGVHTTSRRTFTVDDIHFLQAVANVLGQTIERRRVEAALAAEARFLRAQTTVAEVALSSLQSEALMPRMLATICRAQDYTYGFFLRPGDKEEAAVVGAACGQGTEPFLDTPEDLRATHSFVAHTLRAMQPIFCNHVADSPFGNHPATRSLAGQALLGLPLIGRTGKVMGALVFGDTKCPERFTKRDRQQGSLLMHQVVQALENCELFDQVQRLEEQSRVLTEALHDAVYMVDLEGRMVFANAAMTRLTGYRMEDLLEQPSLMLYPADLLPQILERRRRALGGQYVPPYMQGRMVRKDGQQIAVEQSMANLVLEGNIVGRVVVTRDITERLHLETQLRQSQKMQAMGTLTGGIAHDFNNILGVMLGYTELTLDDVPQTERAYHNLRQVLTAGARARELVRQMLMFSRQTEQEHRPIQLYHLATEVLTMLRAALPSTITLQHNLESRLGPVMADPTQIHQVLMNLCTNAEHAMRHTGGVLEISLEALELPTDVAAGHPDLLHGVYICLTVRDTGHGMTPAIQERIFEPFFTTKGIGEGTGLGLAVVHGIVVSHGGAITVDSAPDQGATFAVYLPQRGTTTPVTVHPEDPVPKGHEHILFVDDEDGLARFGQAALTHLGYDVATYTSSVEALETFRGTPERFDLVITDYTMPQMTGEVLARELRRIRPDIPIIICTGYSHAMTKEKAELLGINAFCMKPMRTRDLGLLIREVLAQRPAPRRRRDLY